MASSVLEQKISASLLLKVLEKWCRKWCRPYGAGIAIDRETAEHFGHGLQAGWDCKQVFAQLKSLSQSDRADFWDRPSKPCPLPSLAVFGRLVRACCERKRYPISDECLLHEQVAQFMGKEFRADMTLVQITAAYRKMTDFRKWVLIRDLQSDS